jgi:hypothetical protein
LLRNGERWRRRKRKERDTGITSEKGVTRRIARGYLLYLLTGEVERCQGEFPPPHTPLPFLDSFEAAADLEDSLELRGCEYYS